VPQIEIFKNDPHAETYPAGHHIFETGDAAQTMYVVVDGDVEIRLGDRVLEVVQPGGIFGEMALVDGQARSASAIARTGCTVVPVTRSRFTYLVQNTPFFALEVMQVMAGRLRRMDVNVQ
jgi:CRP/FNR family transcriptional regulator, cyclic AMP receptor protein